MGPSQYDVTDTIVAVASPPGGAARGIVRLSGPDVAACVLRVFSPIESERDLNAAWPRRYEGKVKVDASGDREHHLSANLYLWPTIHSYTRQPIAELHAVGSPPLLDAVTSSLCSAGARAAQPGEFTLRAFLAGRLDLAQAEAVLGLIDAQHQRQFDVALAQLAGGLSGPLHQICDELMAVLAQVEAGLDFVDEDIEFISAQQLDERLAFCRQRVRDAIDQMQSRANTATHLRVVLTGPPNAGKSTLFNSLIEKFGQKGDGASAALVSPMPGTTRDYLVGTLQLARTTIQLVDTAGMGEKPNNDSIERQAQLASRQLAATADIVLHCRDATSTAIFELQGEHCMDVITKVDLTPSLGGTQRIAQMPTAVPTSSATGEGLDELANRLILHAQQLDSNSSVVAATAARCYDALTAAEQSLSLGRDLAKTGNQEELVANEIRTALNHIGSVVGAVYTDDILDRIFGQFCIGK